MAYTEAQLKPGLTATGEKWYQNCYVCNKQINFFKAPKESWLSIGDVPGGSLIRHRKCYPK